MSARRIIFRSGNDAGRQGAAGDRRTSLPTTPFTTHVNEGVIRRKASCACGGGCPRCQDEAGQTLQAKLRVGEPGDEYEREADSVAEQLTAAHASFDARGADGGAHTDAAPVQLKAAGGGASANATPSSGAFELPGVAPHAAHGAGRPLPDSAREFFEPRLGVSLGSVRVHTDASADASARALDARAYTAGEHVVFAAGEYAPDTTEGRRLLAHELTHVAQQRASHTPSDVVRRQPAGKGGFRPLDEDGQKRCLEAFDRSVKEMETRVSEESLKKVTDDKLKETKSVEDMRKSAALLKKLREGGQVICGTFDNPLKFAVYDYDGPGGKVQLRVTEGVAGSTSNLMHEGIHGVHGEKYPKTAKAYSEVQSGARQPANKTEEQNLLRYKAWTEYWAVRRAAEFDNLDPNRKPEFRVDPAKTARDKPDVRAAVVKVLQFDPTFNPETWTPPG